MTGLDLITIEEEVVIHEEFITYNFGVIKYLFPKFIVNVAFVWAMKEGISEYRARSIELQTSLNEPKYSLVILWYEAHVHLSTHYLVTQVRVLTNGTEISNQ
ncbi:MAG: hypothetical protein COA82_03455 [Alkaliphilus sp.]|nr:MAG: hypothetical protein COA82_03455 [Alkaliphilus sp.]